MRTIIDAAAVAAETAEGRETVERKLRESTQKEALQLVVWNAKRVLERGRVSAGKGFFWSLVNEIASFTSFSTLAGRILPVSIPEDSSGRAAPASADPQEEELEAIRTVIARVESSSPVDFSLRLELLDALREFESGRVARLRLLLDWLAKELSNVLDKWDSALAALAANIVPAIGLSFVFMAQENPLVVNRSALVKLTQDASGKGRLKKEFVELPGYVPSTLGIGASGREILMRTGEQAAEAFVQCGSSGRDECLEHPGVQVSTGFIALAPRTSAELSVVFPMIEGGMRRLTHGHVDVVLRSSDNLYYRFRGVTAVGPRESAGRSVPIVWSSVVRLGGLGVVLHY
ncbi:MAG: hypothetical protein R3B72_24525 [Polyangiaceae bacterium]